MKYLLTAALLLLATICHAADEPPQANPALIKAQLRALFMDAAREGRTEELATFIDAGYDLETRDERGYSALILAAYHGQDAAVEQLLNAGANACGTDNKGNTAMMGAIFKGNLSIARRLMAADCSPDQRNQAGQTPAMYAALFQRQDILDALAAKGADMSLKDAAGNDVQHLQHGQFSAPQTQ